MAIMEEMDEATVDEREETPPWIDSMAMMLGSMNKKHVQPCSIYMVPEQLRKSKVEAYMPKVISIGPIHKGTRKELEYMEQIKWQCMLYLLHRSPGSARESLSKCSKAMLVLNETVRATYDVDDLKFKGHDLAKIMVLDGCFLLEVLISGSEELNCTMESRFHSDYYPSPGAEVIKREEVLSDLTLLENQIPLVVLNKLFTLLFPYDFIKEDGEKTIHNLALSLLGYTLGSNVDPVHDLIGLVHRSFIDKEESESSSNTAGSEKVEGTQGNKDHSIPMPSDGDAEISHEKGKPNTAGSDKVEGTQGNKDHSHEKVKLKWCATKLQAAGVTIKPIIIEHEPVQSSEPRQKGNILVEMLSQLLKIMHIKWHEQRKRVKKNPTPKEIRFDLNIRFHNRELEIPPLHITETTEDKWRNFIAWEVNRTEMQRFISREGDRRTECKFISYALFFQSLICCGDDIQLLKDKNIIVVHERNKEGKMKATSNNDLLTFFRELTDGIPDDLNYVDPSFRELFNALNSHPRAWCNPTIIWHTFRYYSITLFTYWRKIFTRDHTQWKTMGGVGVALTAIQTFYTILGYK